MTTKMDHSSCTHTRDAKGRAACRAGDAILRVAKTGATTMLVGGNHFFVVNLSTPSTTPAQVRCKTWVEGMGWMLQPGWFEASFFAKATIAP